LHARDFKEMAKILTEQQNDLNFGRRKAASTFNDRIIDEHLAFPYLCYYFANLMNNPPILKLQSRDQNLI